MVHFKKKVNKYRIYTKKSKFLIVNFTFLKKDCATLVHFMIDVALLISLF